MSADAIVYAARQRLLFPEEAEENPEKRMGLSYGNPATREAYGLVCLPLDTDADRDPWVANESGCGWVCEDVLRISEVDGRIDWKTVRQIDMLRVPYVKRWPGGYGCPTLAYQRELGRQRKLRVDSLIWTPDNALPDPAAMITLGGDPPKSHWPPNYIPQFGGIGHVEIIIRRDGRRYWAVAGGQTDVDNGGLPTAIKLVERELVWVGKKRELWACPPGTPDMANRPAWGGGRRVQDWTLADQLPVLTPPARGA